MNLAQKIDRAFAARFQPAQVRLADEVLQLDSDVEDALWFSGRNWHRLTWEDWQAHSAAIFFFDSEAFAYYLPSMLVLSAENPTETLTAADSLIDQLDRSPDAAGWTEAFVTRFLELHPVELDLLKEWKTGYAVLPAWASSPHMTYQPSDNRAHCMAQWVFMKKLQALDNSVTTMNLANSSMPTLALNRAAKCRTASSGLMNTRIVGGSR